MPGVEWLDVQVQFHVSVGCFNKLLAPFRGQSDQALLKLRRRASNCIATHGIAGVGVIIVTAEGVASVCLGGAPVNCEQADSSAYGEIQRARATRFSSGLKLTSRSRINSVGVNLHVKLARVVLLGLSVGHGRGESDNGCGGAHVDRLWRRFVWAQSLFVRRATIAMEKSTARALVKLASWGQLLLKICLDGMLRQICG